MRLNQSARVLFLAVSVVGIPAVWNMTARAASPSAAPGVIRLDADDKYITPLREDRTKLEEVKADLQKETADPHGHRHLAIEAIDKAMKDISDEIAEYKSDNKK